MTSVASTGDAGEPGTVNRIAKLTSSDPLATREDARRTIAIALVFAYLGILALNIAVPVALLLWIGRTAPSAELSAIKDILALVAAGTGSVTGVIGFVLGYYFKSEEKGRNR